MTIKTLMGAQQKISTHNLSIERLWTDVYEGVLTIYYQLFYILVDEGIRDPFNNSHFTALHYVYQPKLINEKLELRRNAWSKHRMRTVRSSPIHPLGFWSAAVC